ncbi:MAG: hypothetical protein U1C33_00425, partial [Candidatus Cloacimonadaceae bacterium]|nr:hypothetical protein [Candidatus Cloacimonadaceae bacterium]
MKRLWKFLSHRLLGMISMLAFVISAFALIIWLTPRWGVLSLGEGLVPIAPLTAGVFLLLSGSMLTYCIIKSHKYATTGLAGVALLTTLVCLGVLVQRIFPAITILENLLVGESATLGGIPLGRMSPATASLLGIFCMGLLLRFSALKKHFWSRQLSAVLNIISLLASFTIIVSYITGMPLLYGYFTIPVSLITSILLFLINIAFMGYSTQDVWPAAVFASPEGLKHDSARHFRIGVMTAFIFFTLTVGTTTVLYLRAETQSYKQSIQEQLESIAELKA